MDCHCQALPLLPSWEQRLESVTIPFLLLPFLGKESVCATHEHWLSGVQELPRFTTGNKDERRAKHSAPVTQPEPD